MYEISDKEAMLDLSDLTLIKQAALRNQIIEHTEANTIDNKTAKK